MISLFNIGFTQKNADEFFEKFIMFPFVWTGVKPS